MTFWSRDHEVRWQSTKVSMRFHQTYSHQTWQVDEGRDPHPPRWSFKHMVKTMSQSKNIMSSLQPDQWHQTLHDCYLQWGNPTRKATIIFDHKSWWGKFIWRYEVWTHKQLFVSYFIIYLKNSFKKWLKGSALLVNFEQQWLWILHLSDHGCSNT